MRDRRPSAPPAAFDAFHTLAAAEYLGLSAPTLTSMRCRGQGPSFYRVGRRVCYTRADLDEFLASCRVESFTDTDPALQALLDDDTSGNGNLLKKPVLLAGIRVMEKALHLPRGETLALRARFNIVGKIEKHRIGLLRDYHQALAK